MKKRLISLLLALLFVLPLCVQAEGDLWTCPTCGQEGNTGNYCSNCATPRPSREWTCPACGQEGNTGNFCSNCGTPKPDGSAEASGQAAPADPALEQIPGETDKVMVVADLTEASSFIANKKDPEKWIPENAADGDETTCWQFSAKKGLKGKSWIAIAFNAAQTVDELWFKNGFWAYNDKGKDQYPINARLKGIRVEFLYGDGSAEYRDAKEYTLADDRSDWQRIDIGRHEEVTRIRIAVLSSYKGSSFPNDVCLSEVMAVRNAPASSAMPPREQKAATVYESRPDITGCSLKMKLATRSGPGTQFTDAGTFFQKNWKEQTVLVYKKKYDGSLWWVQVDFRNGKKKKYRVWTGAEKERVDVDLSKVKEEVRICDCDIYPTSDTRFGPGTDYQESKLSINRSAVGTIFQFENGWVDVEYWYEDDGFDGSTRRIWIPESAVYNLYYGDYSGE